MNASQPTSSWRNFDFLLLGAVALLVIFGITMIRSAVGGNIEAADSAVNQIIFAVAGFVALIVLASIDYHFWAAFRLPMYWIMIATLFVLKLIGGPLFGSARWFRVGPILLQPSEFAKIVMILVLADFFTRYKHRMGEISVIIRSFILTMGLTSFILLQPNLSTSIVMLVLWISMLWVAGLKIKHVLIFAGIGLAILAVTVPVIIEVQLTREPFLFLQPYQVDRITSFLFFDEEATYGEQYNIQQALISIGSGGLLGQGYGQGSQIQLAFLKVRWSDFIFASLSHEFGFVGASLIILMLLFIFYRCLRAARLAKDTFGALIAYGVATLMIFQAMVNIGVNLKMMPATGLTLPFVSYGGSSLLSILLAIGLVESVIVRQKSMVDMQ